MIPEIVYIDGEFASGNRAGQVVGYNAFTTIQAGIDLVATGGVVRVAAGDYEETLTVTKPLALLSESGAENTVIRNTYMADVATLSVLAGPVQVGDEGQGFTLVGFDSSEAGQVAVQVGSEASESTRINYNRFSRGSGAGVSAVVNLGDNELDAEKNWFDAESGPTHSSNPDGRGAAVSDFVRFNPWYTDSALTQLYEPADGSEQTTALGTPLAWLEQNGIVPPAEGPMDWDALDLEDSDGDGIPNWQEYRDGTDPRDAESLLKFVTIEWCNDDKFYLEWLGGTNGLGTPYDIEFTPTLNPANWQRIGQRERVQGVHDWMSPSLMTTPSGFFRIATPLSATE
ncbi:MAG: hypothetical protein WC959_07870 [Kiritimatiellales bacterium]